MPHASELHGTYIPHNTNKIPGVSVLKKICDEDEDGFLLFCFRMINRFQILLLDTKVKVCYDDVQVHC